MSTAAYTWTFEISFLVFLLIVFVAQAIAAQTKSYFPMPLAMGLIFIAGFASGLLPSDMIQSSNMIQVGTIAFNCLVIHSGTMISIPLLKSRRKEAGICLISTGLMFVVVCFVMRPLVGREIALMAPGSIVGGGASCAIASKWTVETAPRYSVFPWLVFMFQGLFCIPLTSWALKKEAAMLVPGGKTEKNPGRGQGVPGLVYRIPKSFKTTAYYLGTIMAVSVLNKLLIAFLASFGLNLNLNMTALIFGFILGQTGLLDKAPLFQSDSYGLLILGLMGLMANTLAMTIQNGGIMSILYLLPGLIAVMAAGTAVLALSGFWFAKKMGMSPYRGVILTCNCMMGYPVNQMLAERFSQQGKNEQEKAYIRGELTSLLSLGTMLISNGLSIFLVGILVNFV